MQKIYVEITKLAQKQIKKAPKEIILSIQKWVFSIEEIGIEQTRKIGGKGLNDEMLKGDLKGLRSIRLNKSWRLYYSESNEVTHIILIERVDKHRY